MSEAMKIIPAVCFVLIGTLPQITNATIVKGLYESEQLVTSQSRTERESAMAVGLADVFAKVSGQLDLTFIEGIKTVLEKPSRFVQQYRYQTTPGVATIDNPEPLDRQVVWIRFDKKAVNRTLRQNKLPVWGSTRPETLIWLAIEQDGGRYLLGSDTLEDIREVLERQAKRRGVPVLLPLLDLQDQRVLNFADVWGNFREAILQASKRYQVEAILVGRMSLSRSDTWLGRWTMYEQGRTLSWHYQGSLAEDVLDAGVAGTLKTLAASYTQVHDGSTPATFEISVINVRNLRDYARVAKYLVSLQQIKGVHPKEVNATSVIFTLNIRGNQKGLVQTIKLGNVLEPEQSDFNNPNAPVLDGRFSQFGPIAATPFDIQPVDTELVYRLIQ
jgi:hypothetical protein